MHFSWGYNSHNQLGEIKENLKEKIYEPSPITSFGKRTYIQSVSPSMYNTCFITEDGTLRQIGSHTHKKWHKHNKMDSIDQIDCGSEFWIVKTTSGKVFSWGENKHGQLGFEVIKSTDEPTQIPFFKDKSVRDVACGVLTTYIITEDHKLYSFGYNYYGQTGKITESRVVLKVTQVASNALKVFSGRDSHFMFLQTLDHEIYACGRNEYGQLGVPKIERLDSLTLLPFFEGKNIVSFACSFYHTSVLVIENGVYTVYTSGGGKTNGIGVNSDSFVVIPSFINEDIRWITSGSAHSLAMNSKKEIFIWGKNAGYGELGMGDNPQFLLIPTRIIINNLDLFGQIDIICGSLNTFVYSQCKSTLHEELRDFFFEKKLANFVIPFQNGDHKIEVHLEFINARIGSENAEKLKGFLLTKSANFVEHFFQWVYYGEFSSAVKETLMYLGFDEETIQKNIRKNSLIEMVNKMYLDENTKDFAIVVGNQKIKAHKSILYSRSGLFKGMFLSVTNDKSNQVNDYSNRSAKSIEQFIYFLYHDKFEGKVKKKKKFLKELDDADDYYQIYNKNYFRKILQGLRIKI
ncbi:btk-binding protein-related [Anaeramoeba ignava]|uniref:Btk-binding protein-related n=1 Tax=Anaeramoeba ignava TaxID=1746090 RepID=A0A9Q0LNB0_ANAIG|nr:btk-binding protein-related [Anaeramoeba ignava]